MTVPTPGPEPLHGYRLRDYDDLIATLAQSRDSQGIAVAELARQLGASVSQVRRWLAGEWPMVGSLGLRMADALGYDLALIPREEP